MQTDFDIAVLGSGFGGTITAMIARQLGYSTVLLERGRHPRFAIGESSTPFSNLLLERIAIDYQLPELLELSDWGRWQAAHPEISCGLKRGFSFFHHHRGEPFRPNLDHNNEMLVGASPRDSLADTHWYRPELDAYLVRTAEQRGVRFLDESAIVDFQGLDSPGIVTLHARRHSEHHSLRARYVIDATGPRGALFKTLALPEASLESMPRTETLFSHFRGVTRWDHLFPNPISTQPPYPIDDSAVHHVFDGGWIWMLRFNNGVVSAGIAAHEDLAEEFSLDEGAAAWNRVLRAFPSIEALFAKASAIEPFRHLSRASFRAEMVQGPNWMLLPSAAGFVDPILSTGFALNLLGISRLGRTLREHGLGTQGFQLASRKIAKQFELELNATARLVGSLYANMRSFDRFRSLTLLYFAAMSYSETAWRLGRPELADSFLLCDQEPFAARLEAICQSAADPRFPVATEVLKAIAPIDVAGLSNFSRKHWFPADARDLLSAHAKLGVTREIVFSYLAHFEL